jgi:hypothetical protein
MKAELQQLFRLHEQVQHLEPESELESYRATNWL